MRKYRLVETDTGEEIEADSDTVERVAGVSAKETVILRILQNI